jgi:PAS domain S-box-containing protein
MRTAASFFQDRKLLAGALALAILYYLGARIGLVLAVEKTNSSPVWPSAGIAVAGLLLLGWRIWPGIWLGAFVGNAIVYWQNQVGSPMSILTASTIIASGNTLGALMGWYACARWIGRSEDGSLQLDPDLMFDKMSVFQFACAALAAGLTSAVFGPAVVCAWNIAPWEKYPLLAFTWFCGDATGILYMTPFLLSIAPASWFDEPQGMDYQPGWRERIRRRPGFWSEAVLAFMVLGATCWFVMAGPYSKQQPGVSALVLNFLIIAPLTWIAVRIGSRVTSVALILMAAFVVWQAKRQHGELNPGSDIHTTLVWLGFLWIGGVISLTLASIVTTNKRAIGSLRAAKAALEATMDAIPAMVCVAHDSHCNGITGNSRAHEMLRVPQGKQLFPDSDDGPNGNFEIRINGVNPPLKELAMHKAAATGKPVVGQEQEVIFPDGDVRIIYGNAVPLRDDYGDPRGCVAAFVDVTERRRDEKALRESKQQLAADLAAMTRMQQVSVSLVQAGDFATLLHEILDAAIEISHADMGLIQLLEDGSPRIVAQRGFDESFINFFDKIPEGGAASWTAMQHSVRIIIEDVTTSPVFANTPALDVMLEAGARAVQFTPLVSRSGRVLGLFSTHYHEPQRPGDQAVRLLDILARQAADLIERTQAEWAMRESEERFRTMADLAPVMIWMSGADTHCNYFNAPWLEFTGRPIEQEVAEGWLEGVHPDDRTRFMDTYVSSFNARLEFKVEFRLRRHDGEYRWILDHGVPRFGAAGEFIGYIGSCMDITDRRRDESDTSFLLGLSEQRRRASTAEDAMACTVDALGLHFAVDRCLFASVDAEGDNFTVGRDFRKQGVPLAGAYSMSTFGPDVVSTLRAGRFVTITDVGRDFRTAGRAVGFRRMEAGACAIAPLLRDGRTVALLAIITRGPRIWDQREISLFITVAERMWLAMERLRLTNELSASEARFRTMAEWVPVFIFTTGPDGRVDYINERFSDYTGMAAHTAAGDGWMQVIHPEDMALAMHLWRSSVTTGQPFSCGLRMRSSDGDHRWFRINAHPVYAEHGRIVKWFGSCADIDDLMRSQTQLRALNDKLEERVTERTAQLLTANNELEREFQERQRLEVQMLEISERERRVLGQDLHDGLCQHLSGLSFMAATLALTLRDKGMRDDANKLEDLTGHIRSAAGQARDVAKGLHPVDVDANGLVAALKDLAARYSTKGTLQCRLHCVRPVPVQDNSVALHLYRIAQEAVVNAIKHAGAGRIVIDLSSSGEEITLSVWDDGHGLPEKSRLQLGMGLHLMKYRAGVIGGKLTIQRAERGGTMVTCVLPVRPVDEYDPPAVAELSTP